MKILIIGGGGREHAIAWKVAQSERVQRIYCAPGNGGTVLEEKCENVNLTKTEDLIEFALDKGIDLTIVGPEANLVDGVVDAFKLAGLRIFGPSRSASRLEGSKVFAKDFMKKYGVKTAAYEVFQEEKAAINYLGTCDYPVVIKADGLAAGKGVVICSDFKEAEAVIHSFIVEDIFKGSGKTIVVEEYLEGVEASILSITDGETIIPFISSKDHKQIFDGNKGPNTGGMGVVAPNPYCTPKVLEAFNKDIMLPTINGIKIESMDYVGIIFFGVMITKKGIYNLEYNVRMGDPETEAVLPLMQSDFVTLIEKALAKDLKNAEILWSNNHACTVIAVSEGYPGEYITGFEITGFDTIDSKGFIAGAKYINDKLLTSGGRVLAITATGKSLKEAREKAYKDMEKVKFEGKRFRKDIGEVNCEL